MDVERLSGLCLDISTEWQNVQITYKNKHQKEKLVDISLIYTGSNGVYVFLEEKYKDDATLIYQELENLFRIRGDGLYLFFYNEDNKE